MVNQLNKTVTTTHVTVETKQTAGALGTAHSRGTATALSPAHAEGTNNGTIKNNESALVNELGNESIVNQILQWHTVTYDRKSI
jgi:hypothetical protein